MRKHHMQAVIDHLKAENSRLRDERAGMLGDLHEKAVAHSGALAAVRSEVTALRDAVTAVRDTPGSGAEGAVPIKDGRRSKTA